MALLYVLAAIILFNCAYYLLFTKFPKSSSNLKPTSFPVSLIVCAKNEAENLQHNIPKWLSREYPNFELILINDASVDNTADVMEEFAEKDARIKIVTVQNNEAFWASKKYALTLGIKRAVNKKLVFTDADCTPASNKWLSFMVQHLQDEKELVLGYGPYQKKPGLLNKLIRYETLMTATQYFSYTNMGMPYMGVGRNLAYTSDLFYANRGYMSHIKVPSGDDDLFVNESATSSNTIFCTAAAAFTYSVPKTSWKAWYRQKRRHYSTATRYKLKHRLLLGGYYSLNLLFWVLAVACFFLFDWRIVLGMILLRFTIQVLCLSNAAKRLRENDITPYAPLFELFLILFQLRIFISNSTTKQSRWK